MEDKVTIRPALGIRALTPLYEVGMRLFMRERNFKSLLLQAARLAPGITVLDLGCGTGTLALMAAEAAPSVSIRGLDADPAMVERARRKTARRGLEISFNVGLAQALPYPDAFFDRVLSTLLFHHLPPAAKPAALAEARRVLKPGGELYIADWGLPANGVMRAAFFAAQLVDGFANTRDHVNGSFPNLIATAGFASVSHRFLLNTVFGTLELFHAVRE